MTKKYSTKKALVASVLSLVLCFSMLIGTTFAWFTDSVTSANNIITSGNLDIELYYQHEGETTWTKVTETTNIFKEDALWEPGHTEVVKLKVVNEGSLALKYTLGVNVASEVGSVNKNGEAFKLSDYIMFAVIDGANDYTRDEAILAAEREGATPLKAAYNSGTTALPATEDDVVTMVVYMPTTVGNEANAAKDAATPSINLGLNLYATQLANEEDSFGSDYDKDAWHPDMIVGTVEELAQALALGGKVQVIGTLNAGTTQDVPNWTNAPAEYILDATTLDALFGGEYILEQGSRYGVVALVSANESLTLSDMKITANSQWPVYLSNYGGTLVLDGINVTATQGAGIYPYGTNGTTTIKNATVNQQALSDQFAASTPWAGTAIATSNGHNLIIEDGVYVGSSWGVYAYNSGASVTINGGTFKAPTVIQADGVWSGSNKSVVTVNGGNFDGAIKLDWGTNAPEIYINGGNFTNFSATVYGSAKLVITGGTFDADPSRYVSEGCLVLNNSDGTYSVHANNASAVLSFKDGAVLDLGGVEFAGTVVAEGDLTIQGDTKIKTLKAINGGTITIENGKTLTLNNFSFGSVDTAGAEYEIKGGTIVAAYGFFQHGTYALYSDFETGYMYYSYGSDITVYGTFHSQGKGDGLDYVRGKLTVAAGGKSIHDKSLWVGQPANWGAMNATLIVEEGGYVQANTLSVYDGSVAYNNNANVGIDGVGIKYNNINGVITLVD